MSPLPSPLNPRRFFPLILLVLTTVDAQQESSCYGSGSMAAAVILSIICTALLIIGLLYWWQKRKQAKEHLILETDPEKGKGEYAFDNPGFKDTSILPPESNSLKKSKLETSLSNKWNQWSPLNALTKSSDKRKTLDDSALEGTEVKVVALRSHDFTGLGFNICGNIKEGIYIKDILHRGPAFESGRLSPGDKINSVTISFEHMVCEDALTILSYASPYEVIIEARSGKILHNDTGHVGQPGHPVYRSSSCADLYYDKNARNSDYSSLQKSRSNLPSLERNKSKSPKPSLNLRNPLKQLKTQLEHKMSPEPQKPENKYQKFGVKVLPSEQKSPKIAELSQNDNNINLEKHQQSGIDEVDQSKTTVVVVAPQAKRREKKVEEPFVKTSLNSSGIKRDKNGIPQEIPSHMLNAAVAARRNRKSVPDLEDTPKKKGKAPSPPEDKINYDEIHSVNDDELDLEEETVPEVVVTNNHKAALGRSVNYNSDSDLENDNQSSVNTIELNSNDITVHQTEDENMQNRKTASTGDLTKIQKRKTSTGTLERAQSLDITGDTGMSSTLKRKGAKIEEDEDIFGKMMLNKAPRLSLILDSLNTFQKNSLKKSTEWGNLEDAILKLNQEEQATAEVVLEEKGEFDALVKKINEIKGETVEETQKVKNEIWPTFETMKVKPVELEVKLEEPEVIPEIVDVFQPEPEVKAVVLEDSKLLKSVDNSWKVNTFEDLGSKIPVPNTDETKTVLLASSPEERSLKEVTENFLFTEKINCNKDKDLLYVIKADGMNVSDDIKVKMHSFEIVDDSGKSDDAKTDSLKHINNITINNGDGDLHSLELSINERTGDAYMTALETPPSEAASITISTPTIKDDSDTNSASLTYITEIKVTPNNSSTSTNISEIEIIPTVDDQRLDTEFENYVKNFECNVQYEPNIPNFESTLEEFIKDEPKSIVIGDSVDELHKIQEIADEQLKKLPEMRFVTTSYESSKPPSGHNQIELLRMNFEKKGGVLAGQYKHEPTSLTKSRIPVATTAKTPPISPERRDSRNLDNESDRAILELITSSAVHSTPKPPKVVSKNVTVTSIRSNSKIPSGLPTLRHHNNNNNFNNSGGFPRKIEVGGGDHVVNVSTSSEESGNSYQQWAFRPASSVTNISVSESKPKKT